MAYLFFPLILILGYFLLVRPQQNQARQQRALISSLQIGVEVQTAGGIVGRVIDLDDQYVQLQVGPGTTITFVRSAVARLLSEAPGLDAEGGAGPQAFPASTEAGADEPTIVEAGPDEPTIVTGPDPIPPAFPKADPAPPGASEPDSGTEGGTLAP